MRHIGLFAGIGGGIYEIRNVVTDEIYVGSCVNLRKRYSAHLCLLRNGKHANIKLQRSFYKYGEGSFQFTVIIRCSDECLTSQEQQNVDELKPSFNIRAVVESNLGTKLSDETN